MKAAVYYETGSPDVLRYEDVPDPVVHPKGVLERLRVATAHGERRAIVEVTVCIIRLLLQLFGVGVGCPGVILGLIPRPGAPGGVLKALGCNARLILLEQGCALLIRALPVVCPASVDRHRQQGGAHKQA